MGEKKSQGKVYEFIPGKVPKLKKLKYVSPEKKQLLIERKQAQRDKKNFYIGAGIFLIIVMMLTFWRLR